MAIRPSPLSYIQFGALTAQDWLSFAIKITKPYNRGSQEVDDTPYDPRLGALANGTVCPTCEQTNKMCPGHWGVIELEEPCYNPEYIDIVLGIFKCVCINCCSPLIPENMAGSILSLSRSTRFKAYKKKAESLKQCPACQKLIAAFFIDKRSIKMCYEEKKGATPISAREACAILMRISSDTMKLIGFNDGLSQNPLFFSEDILLPDDKTHIHEVRPEAYIFTVFPVMPTCARPWVIKGSERKDDDITDKYNTILKNNERLRADREAPASAQPVRGRKKNGKLSEADRFKTIEDLHFNIWSVIDNSKEKSKNSSRKHKGIKERLGGKDGHFQSNVAGKRSDYTARTVIVGGGSLLEMGWVGIPYHIAKVLTTPELVLGWNISEYERLLTDGRINTVCRGGYTIDVQEVTGRGTKPFSWKGHTGLQIYDIVHRQLRDGDWGIFNRQPTLRIESMQGVQVKILPGEGLDIFDQEYAFRLPLAVTRAYNADFDGDEMNFHLPQSQGARVECSTISKTAFHIVSAQNNAPVMGCVQNTLVCMYVITESFLTPEETAEGDDALPNYTFPDGTPGYQTMIDTSDFMDAVTVAGISIERYQDLVKRAAKYYPDFVIEEDDNLRFVEKIPGKIVASVVFPSTFTWSRETGVNEKLSLVDIKDGIIQPNSGPLEKKCIGGTTNSAIHPLWKIGPEVAAKVISELQFMTTVLITRIGFSMGPSDCFPTGEIDVDKVRTEALIKCEMILESDKNPLDKEREINGVLNDAMSIAPKLAKMGMNKRDRNALVIMKKSGAKGSDTNNGQIAGFVGQQNIDGKRPSCMLSDRTRTLPHFFSGDRSPDALGFVRHSYLEGLSFSEVWFHAMGGRRGVVDTALKSVTYDTRIMIDVDGMVSVTEIGKLIDDLMEKNKADIKKEGAMDMLAFDALIPTTDSKGCVSWSEITAVTRHPPTAKLYKIVTQSGRKVTVADTKSLLVWNEDTKEFVQTQSSKVKIGDKMPTTVSLSDPNGLVTHLDLSVYLPKDKYVYGSEMEKCESLSSSMRYKSKWWEDNNGLLFTLPYKSWQTFKKANKSSKKDIGYLYPITGNCRTRIPEMFEFNDLNGFFIGIYLAEGHSDIKSGIVCITNNDPEIRGKVTKWYDSNNMSYHIQSRKNKIGGTSTMIRGVSRTMATFLKSWLGDYSYTKRIPDEILSAPKEFIGALLDGYFSGDGTVSKRSGDVIVGSSSKLLIEGISILCSRFGIFGKLSKTQLKSNNLGTENPRPCYVLSIRSKWAFEFARSIGFTHKGKRSNLRTTADRLNSSAPVYIEARDVVLDPIVSIKLVSPKELYVYDLTVPSTTNFCLANGLHVVDTADSGYIQKKIVNAINDFKVRHDGSVRDANGGIVQFAYGGDGLNAKELIPCNGLDFPFFVNVTLTAAGLNTQAEKLAEDEGAEIGEMRCLTQAETNLLVSFIEYLCAGKKTEVSERITFNIRTILRSVIKNIKIYETMIPLFCRKIKDEFEEARAKNGYMAGLAAASSIGEPTTQMSASREEKIPIMIKCTDSEKIIYLNDKIGDVIDSILKTECKMVFHEGTSKIGIPFCDIEIYVHTVDPITSKTAWKKVQEVSKHPANGGMIKITTKSGRNIITTLSHSHLQRSRSGEIVPIRGDQLVVGNHIPVCGKMDVLENISEINAEGKLYPLDFIVGWMFGAYLSEGNVNHGRIGITNISPEFEQRCHEFAGLFGGNVNTQYWHSINGSIKQYESVTQYISGCTEFGRYLVKTCGSGSKNKHVPAFALFAPEEFVKGLIRGYFDGDGNVSSPKQLIRFHSISKDLIETMGLLLTRFGIFGTIGIEKKDSPNPLYSYRLLRKHASIYFEKIGSDHPDKIKGLEEIIAYNNRENVHSQREDIDVIPGVGLNISAVAKPLGLPGYSRTYKRHENKPFIGRETLKKYLEIFEEKDARGTDFEILKTAAEANIIWDQIVSLEILEDPDDFVYDLGVSGNHTFMLQSGIFTHNTLNTFHNAGNSAKDVTLGVPRLKELINATKNPSKPTCTAYLDEKALHENLERRSTAVASLKKAESAKKEKEIDVLKEEIASLDKKALYMVTDFSAPLAHLTAGFFIKSSELRYLNVGDSQPETSPIGLLTYEEYSPEWWVTLSEDLGVVPRFKPQAWVILLHLDVDEMYKHGITVEDIAVKIEENAFGTRGYAMACVASPNVIGQIEVYLNFTEIGEYARSEIELPRGEIITRHLLTPENVEYFIARDVAIDLIKKTDVQGVRGIQKTYVRQEFKTGEWVIDTQGTNLMKLLGLPGIDPTRTLSDDMWEIYKVLGIEATRKFLFRECNKILSFDGAYINPRHIYLLVDGMTRSGTITSVNRDGIPRDVGPIAKGMFEKAVDNFGEAAAFAEHDKMKGVAAAVMFGTLAEVGSGTVEIKDSEKLPVVKRKPMDVPVKLGTKKVTK